MKKRYGLVIDLEKCTGCQTCRIACKVENDMNIGSGIRVETVGGPYQDTPEGVYPDLQMQYRPVPCMHCGNPTCLEACPVEAIFKRDDGIVLIDKEKCNNCQACISACPYEAIIFDPERDEIRKCSLCTHRLDQGLQPFCVVCCENQAILVGNLNDPGDEVSKLITREHVSTYKPESGTKPAVYYCATRPASVPGT